MVVGTVDGQPIAEAEKYLNSLLKRSFPAIE
jgi:hypothetical protein